MGEKLVGFEITDKIVEYFSKKIIIDIKVLNAYCKENIHFMLHQNYIPFEEYKNSTQKVSMSICIKKMMN